MTDAHLTYDELETPAEMHSDCEAVESELSLNKFIPVDVPARAAYVGVTVKKLATKPVFVVSDAAAKLAGRLNPFD
jgi:hypothetical protein